MREIADHIAIVTGGGGEIGAAVVARLAASGARVVVNDVRLDRAEAVVAGLPAGQDKAVAVGGDVSLPEDVERIFAVCDASFGACTLLVNIAGLLHQSPFEALTIADWDRMIAVNLRGTFLCNRMAIGPMLAAGEGVIINVSSQLGQIGGIDLCHYSAAKAGIIGLTKALAREVSSRGVRVNSVAPGPIDTAMSRALSPEWRREKLASLPLGRYGEPEEVAATVAFLASPESSLFVGQTLGPNSGDVML